ncbi:hypothetical protein [Helicobacter sp. MIT 14-3879]|uniref:hypothetical protein n=1 Tax=Helicobacter sp. MIT 14-3879 TaxID=2040649 RepID=UPI000E1E2D95|nr:hypothetical protein [Helicobacter sp. MIT 14-3879]RDU62100.1 hypothetical protein CQA44_07665 [Helicobacter sp. MIT 14-3879]
MNSRNKNIIKSTYSYFIIAKSFYEYSFNSSKQLLKDYFLFWSIFYLKETLRCIQITGYKKELGFSKSDLARFYSLLKGKYKFCFHFPRIYGFPKKVRIFFSSKFKKILKIS